MVQFKQKSALDTEIDYQANTRLNFERRSILWINVPPSFGFYCSRLHFFYLLYFEILLFRDYIFRNLIFRYFFFGLSFFRSFIFRDFFFDLFAFENLSFDIWSVILGNVKKKTNNLVVYT
jgi:hypothetical protein